MLNKVVIMGRLTAAPDLRYTANETPVVSYCVAVDRDFSKGEDRQTDFIDCVSWRESAMFLARYFNKGDEIIVSGRLQTRTYTDKDGAKRKVTEVVSDNIYFGKKKKQESDEPEDTYYEGSRELVF
jgi:single-strand DNA-binding protein